MSKPSWSKAPEWANWLALDKVNYEWWWYENRPVISQSGSIWDSNEGQSTHASYGKSKKGWKKSLEKRPKTESAKLGIDWELMAKLGAMIFISDSSSEKATTDQIAVVLKGYRNTSNYSYITFSGTSWKYAAPAKGLKNVLIPHDGGECPVADDATVMVYSHVMVKHGLANEFLWEWEEGGNIVGYIEVYIGDMSHAFLKEACRA